jgi:hypothetical protein
MNTETNLSIQLSPEVQLSLLTQITSGLLASGHFTDGIERGGNPGGEQIIRGVYTNENNKRVHYLAVEEAASLILSKLIQSVEEDINR